MKTIRPNSRSMKTPNTRNTICILAGSIAVLLAAHSATAQNTVNNYTGAVAGSLLTPGNWSLTLVPVVTNDAVFPSTALTGIRTMTAGDLTVGSFNVLANTGTFSIRNETAGAIDHNLTLGGVGNLGNSVSGTAADLLSAATGSIFNIIGANGGGGGGTGLLKLILGQSGNFNLAGTATSTISAVISDGGNNYALTKTGTGTLTLQGAHTYGGVTTINLGTLQLGTGVAGQNGSVASTSIVNNAALTFNNADAQTYSGVISGLGTLTKSGAGTLTLSNANTVTGTTTITAGILQLGTGVTGQNGSLASANIVNNTTLNFNNFDAQSYAGAISGSGAVTKTSTGTLILSGSNTYASATTINSGGVVNIQNGLALGGAGGSTTVSSGGALEIQGGILTLIEALTLNGTGISSGGALRNISGVNIYNGGLTLGSAARVNSDAGRLILNNTVATAGATLTVGGAGNTAAVSAISGTGGLTKEDAGILGLFAANTYTGNSTINGGAVLLGSAETAGASGPLGTKAAAAAGLILFGGGTMQYSPQNANDYSGRFSTGGGQAIKIDTNSRNVTFATNIVGSGTSVAKSGLGTLTLSGAANTYDGGTTVSGGTLLAAAAGNLPTAGTLAVTGGGTFSMANGVADTAYATNSLTLVNGATLAFDWVGASADLLTSTTAATTAGIIGISVNPISSPAGPQTLLSSALGGLTIPNGTQYFLANNNTYTATLTPGDTAVTIDTVTTGLTALTNNAFWYGNTLAAANTAGVDNAMALSNGTVSNWSTTSGSYTATALVPGSSANVVFSATGATQQSNIVLGADMTLNSVTFNDPTPVTVGSGNALTLLSTATAATSAISTNQDATINAGVILGASQTWTTAATKTLTLGGTIGNVTGGAGLTIAGTGTTVINGTAAYSGSTTVSNGATLTFAAGSRKTFLGSANTLVVTGVVNVAGDVDVQHFGSSGLNGVINMSGTGALTIRSAEANQDTNAGIGGGGYGMLNITGGTVSVLASGGNPGSMNMANGGNQALLRVTGGTLNVGQIIFFRNGAGSGELTITAGTINKSAGPFVVGDRGTLNSVINIAGGLIDNTNQTIGLNRSTGATAGSALEVVNFNAGTIITREFSGANGGYQTIINYNGGTIKASPGISSTTFTPTPAATSSVSSYINGSAAFAGNPVGQQFAGGLVMDTNALNTTINGNLLAPTGNGVTTLSLASGGSGYTGAPIVTLTDSGTTQPGTTGLTNTITMASTTGVLVGQSITGTGIPAGSIVTAVTPNTSITISQNATTVGSPTLAFKGQGATAYATTSAGAVTGFVVTNPGVGYVGTVSATLGGGFGTGGSGTAATLNAITPVANTSGGLTKNGLGTLTLSGANTFTGALAVNDGTLAFGQALGVTNTYAAISGAGAISQTGSGTTVLGSANNYTGITTISAGVLLLNHATALPGGIAAAGGTSALTFNGGVLGLGAGNFTRSLGNAGTATAVNFTGAGGWAAYGANRTVNFGGASAQVIWATPGTGFNAQTVILGNVTATHTVDLQNPLDLGNAARTVQVDNGSATADGQLSGLLSGASGGITKTGAGTLVMSNTGNSYTGGTIVNAGTLLSSASEVLPDASAITVSGNAANVRAILDLSGRNETIGALTLGGSTATSAATVATGTGTLTLGGTVTYSNSSSPLGATIRGNLALGGTSRAFTVNDSTTATYDLTIPAVISGTGVGLTKNQGGNLLLTGANTYDGGTAVTAGTLTLGKRSALYNDTAASWTTTNINVDANATLALGVGANASGYFDTTDLDTLLDGSHLGASTPTAGLKSSSIIGFDTASATGGVFTYNSVIADPGTALTVGVAKLGTGTLTLNGNHAYTGTTTVSQGTLVLNGANTGTGTVTVNGGVLRANEGVGLNTGSLLTITSGVFETGANLERTGGGAAGNMQIIGGATAGFSAHGAPVQVAFGTLASPTALTWGTAPFQPGTLILNGSTANNTLEFMNAVNLNGATRTIQVDANVATMSGVISSAGASGGLIKTGTGTLVLSGNNSYTGPTTVTAGGGISIISGGAGSSVIQTQKNGIIRVDGISDVLNFTLQYNFAGLQRFMKSGAGTLLWSGGTIAPTSDFWINGGVVEIGGSVPYSMTNGTRIQQGASFRYNSSSIASTVSAAISGAGSLEVKAGMLTLTGSHTYTGTTTLDGGILNISSLANGGSASGIGAATNAAGNLVFGGGTLRYTGTAAGATDRLFTIGDAAGNTATIDASGTTVAAAVNFSNTGAIAFGNTSPHTLTLTGSNTGANTLAAAIGDNTGATSVVKSGAGTWNLAGANTYTGATTISAGTLEVTVGSAIGDASAVSLASVAGARLLVSSSETIGSLSGGTGANGEVALGFNTLTVGDASTATFAGTISGTVEAGSLVKQGTGVQNLDATAVLAFDNLTANDGTINVNSALGTGSGTAVVTVNDTGGGAATNLRFGTVSQTLSSLTIGAGATVVFTSGAAGGAFSGGGEGKAAGFGTAASSFGSGTPGSAVVPEPGTLGLLLVGALGVLNRRRRV